ncbi:MAG TPA: hypothetical protein PK559_15410 [Ignavibacteriaceae bacterium]|nr:hypothetical protein [Ignavibacteriaceae bacterium]
MFMKKPSYRIFDYEPRHYDPSTDKSEKLKRRLGFSRRRKSLGNRRSHLRMILIIIGAIVAYIILRNIS